MRQYFRGYYFKCIEADRAIALIPAFHADGERQSASLQVITCDGAYVIPCSEIEFGIRKSVVRLGKSHFSPEGIYLDACSPDCRVYGNLRFGAARKIKYDIMGPFRFIPRMQCRHEVISMSHSVTGRLHVNGRVYEFRHGKGYIEGDRGYSFPREYIWTQCHFAGGSLMLAVAEIPLPGLRFKGIIGVVLIGGREYRIATYLGARVVSDGENEVLVRQGKYTLYAKLVQARHQGLNAPVNGSMTRTIHESVACRAFYRFAYKDRVLLEFESNNSSFEFEMG